MSIPCYQKSINLWFSKKNPLSFLAEPIGITSCEAPFRSESTYDVIAEFAHDSHTSTLERRAEHKSRPLSKRGVVILHSFAIEEEHTAGITWGRIQWRFGPETLRTGRKEVG